MKNLLIFFLAGAFALLLTACSSSKPEDVAVEFFKEFVINNNLDSVAEYVYFEYDEERQKALADLKDEKTRAQIQKIVEQTNKIFKTKIKSVEAVETKVDGNDAEVQVKVSFEEKNYKGDTEAVRPVKLKLVDGKWLVLMR